MVNKRKRRPDDPEPKRIDMQNSRDRKRRRCEAVKAASSERDGVFIDHFMQMELQAKKHCHTVGHFTPQECSEIIDLGETADGETTYNTFDDAKNLKTKRRRRTQKTGKEQEMHADDAVFSKARAKLYQHAPYSALVALQPNDESPTRIVLGKR